MKESFWWENDGKNDFYLTRANCFLLCNVLKKKFPETASNS